MEKLPSLVHGKPITDQSRQGNVGAKHRLLYDYRRSEIFSLGANSGLLANANESIAPDPRICPAPTGVDNLTNRALLEPSLKGINVTQANRYVALSDPIPVQLGDVIVWDGDFDGNIARTAIFPLDADMEPLTDNSGGEFINQLSATFTSTYGRYSNSSDVSMATLRITPAAVARSEVKYVRVGLFLGAAGLIRYFSANLFTQASGRGKSEGEARYHQILRAMNGVPTKGYASAGTAIWDTSGTPTMRRCTFAYETRLSGALAAGATSVTVAAAGTIANNDIVGILLDNGTTHWTTVTGLTGATFTIAAIPAGRSAPDGGRIVFNRWV